MIAHVRIFADGYGNVSGTRWDFARAVFMTVRPKALKCQPGFYKIGSNLTHEFCGPCERGDARREWPAAASGREALVNAVTQAANGRPLLPAQIETGL